VDASQGAVDTASAIPISAGRERNAGSVVMGNTAVAFDRPERNEVA
jgi:hypothetical protein